jgi:hypothetical protein
MKTEAIKDIAVVLTDKEIRSALPRGRHIHFFSSRADKKDVHSFHDIFVLSTGGELPGVAAFIKRANNRKQLRGLLVRQKAFPFWITQMLDMAGLRCLSNLLVYSDADTAKRVLTAWSYGTQSALIADAAVLGDKLLLRDCALKRYELGFDGLRDLSRIKLKHRADFVISPDGSYLTWPDYDIHIGLESVKSALSPQDSKKESRKYDQAMGATIAKFRTIRGLRQTDIDGISERHLRKIETGKQRATTKSLQLLAQAHNLSLNSYLNKLARYAHDLTVSSAEHNANC